MIEERSFVASAATIEARNGSPRIVGYAAVFNSPSEPLPVSNNDPSGRGRTFREIIRPGAFAESLRGSRAIFANFMHEKTAILGSTQNGTLWLNEDARGLRYEIDPPNTSAGRDAVELIRRGDVRMSSFGFRLRGEKGHMLRRDGDQWIRELRSVDLLDVSPVTIGAYSATTVALRSLDSWLEAEGGVELGLMKMRLALAERQCRL